MIPFLLAFLVAHAEAKYAVPQLESVPIERAIENLEKKVRAAKDEKEAAQWRHPLARLHVMAFVAPEQPVSVVKANGLVYDFPYSTRVEQFHPVANPKGKKEHVARALELYELELKADPKNWIARLGKAWTIDQQGRHEIARNEYRALLADALAKLDEGKESDIRIYDVGSEAANYLVTLLDPKRDSAEIKRVQDGQARLYDKQTRTRMISPIVIPDRAGLSLESLIRSDSPIRFDLDGSGVARRWGWPRANAALLAYRDRSDRPIASGLQLFGSVTFSAFWRDGYSALASLDDDGDGKLAGAELRNLVLWTDLNQNGVSESSEIRDVRDAGVLEIRLDAAKAADGTPFHPRGIAFRGGETRPTYDWSPITHD